MSDSFHYIQYLFSAMSVSALPATITGCRPCFSITFLTRIVYDQMLFAIVEPSILNLFVCFHCDVFFLLLW